jgi:hypothetical protein
MYTDLYDLDMSVPTEITVVAGEIFHTMVSEIDNFPNGYAFVDPEQNFTCVNVTSRNAGVYNTGYKIW